MFSVMGLPLYKADGVTSPSTPDQMDWSPYYPNYLDTEATTLDGARPCQLKKDVDIVDIGCGFGGLLMGLAPLFPETLMLGKATLCTRFPSSYSILLICA